jgi:uncharacterized protein (TIGR00369 family)
VPVTVGRDALVAFFQQGIPFNAWLGMTVERLEDGECTLRIPFRPELVGDPLRPALHGGVLSTMADAAGGLAVFSKAMSLETRISTVDMRVDYLRPGRLADLWCDARVIRLGNRVAVTTMVVRQADDHVPAECRGVYNVVRPD